MISIAFVIGIIICLIWGLISIVVAIWGFQDDYDKGFGWGGLISWFLSGIALFMVLFPFDMAYHSFRPVEGVVEAIDKRQVATGESFEEKFAVRFEGSPQIYGCNDTRCSLAKPGDKIKLNCIKSWQWASEHGYDCRYAS